MPNQTSKRDKQIADATTSMAIGVTCAFAALQFLDLERNYILCGIFFAIGLGAVIYANCKWRKI